MAWCPPATPPRRGLFPWVVEEPQIWKVRATRRQRYSGGVAVKGGPSCSRMDRVQWRDHLSILELQDDCAHALCS